MAIKGGAGAVAWHSPMGLTSGAYWMLIVNAAWDICCGASMQLEIVLGRRLWLGATGSAAVAGCDSVSVSGCG